MVITIVNQRLKCGHKLERLHHVPAKSSWYLSIAVCTLSTTTRVTGSKYQNVPWHTWGREGAVRAWRPSCLHIGKCSSAWMWIKEQWNKQFDDFCAYRPSQARTHGQEGTGSQPVSDTACSRVPATAIMLNYWVLLRVIKLEIQCYKG